MPARALGKAEVAAALKGLPGWRVAKGSLHRELEFETFRAAWRFMSRVAAAAEAMDHHPDWSNSYGTVVIDLRTHSKKAITDKDVALARKIQRIPAGGARR